jgi:hypothetical protein
MSENISSNVLFHFTKSMENLKSILKNGFYPRYCPEYTLDPLDQKAVSDGISPMRAAPLVCFCDLPLSLIRKHLAEYGHFGIGLSKEWGFKHGVTPVIYTHRGAQTFEPISHLVAEAEKSSDRTSRSDLMILAAYTKPYVGAAWRDNKVQPDVRFYDEREWRYVPVVGGGNSLFLSREDYADGAKRNALQEGFKTHDALSIHPDHIQYLVVPESADERNILDLAHFVKGLYEPDDAILVTTAIMTSDCIREDV